MRYLVEAVIYLGGRMRFISSIYLLLLLFSGFGAPEDAINAHGHQKTGKYNTADDEEHAHGALFGLGFRLICSIHAHAPPRRPRLSGAAAGALVALAVEVGHVVLGTLEGVLARAHPPGGS